MLRVLLFLGIGSVALGSSAPLFVEGDTVPGKIYMKRRTFDIAALGETVIRNCAGKIDGYDDTSAAVTKVYCYDHETVPQGPMATPEGYFHLSGYGSNLKKTYQTTSGHTIALEFYSRGSGGVFFEARISPKCGYKVSTGIEALGYLRKALEEWKREGKSFTFTNVYVVPLGDLN